VQSIKIREEIKIFLCIFPAKQGKCWLLLVYAFWGSLKIFLLMHLEEQLRINLPWHNACYFKNIKN